MSVAVEEVIAILTEIRFWLLILGSFLVWVILTRVLANQRLDLANPKESALRAMTLAIPLTLLLSMLAGLLILQLDFLRLVMAAVISILLLLVSRTLATR